MKFRPSAIALVLGLVLGACPFRARALVASACRVDITPPVGTPLSGFGSRMGAPSTGILDPLHARVLYLNDGKKDWVLVAVDSLLFFNVWAEKIQERLSFAPTYITFVASHTHAGSGGLLKEAGTVLGSGPFREKVLQRFVGKIAGCIEKAHRNPIPALLGSASEPISGIAANRRFHGGAVDGELRIMKVVSQADPLQTIAVVYNLSAHPTTVTGNSFSADFPGYASAVIEGGYRGSVALFANGTQGDQGPGNPCHLPGMGRTRCLGFTIGWEVLRLAEKIVPHEAHIVAIQDQLLLNPELNIRVKMQAFAVGKAAFLTIPGEAYVAIGNQWKEKAKRLGFSPLFLLGLANDSLGYIVYPESVYHMHVYESLLSLFGPKLGDFIDQEGEDLLSRLAAVASPTQAP